MRPLVAILLLALSPLTAFAGRDSFQAEIASLTPKKKKDEYRLDLIQYELPYASKRELRPAHLIVHLRFDEQMFSRRCPSCPTKEHYLAAIEALKAQAAKGGRFQFGIVGSGFESMKERTGEYQSNALGLLREVGGQKVVYSFPGPSVCCSVN